MTKGNRRARGRSKTWHDLCRGGSDVEEGEKQPDQALTEACAGMMSRPDILVPALYSRLGGRSLFSDDLDDAEIEYGLERCAAVLAEQGVIKSGVFP